MRHSGVEATAYLVNESRARCGELARDPLAVDWIPASERSAVRALWDEFAEAVYAHDDLVVSLRGRCVLEVLTEALRRDPDTVLVSCGAGFTSYPWVLPFRAAVEVDLPEIIQAKRQRVTELRATGLIDDRDVTHIATDLTSGPARQELVERVRTIAAGRPIAFVAEGLVYYLPPQAARAVIGLGAAIDPDALTVVSYWPRAAAAHPVLAAQTRWFREHRVPEDATYLTVDDLSAVLGRRVDDNSPEQLQRRLLGKVAVPERELIPEHVAVAGA
ncbi:class I SAM-dependent methyltransferase [Micromonospora sp. MS34]|uniref:class I SAM-dependent methyltransferase n=1 Tax=Micromonospora sp. MS34 TaxID=3385971 RepID=UPI0039A3959D